MAKAAFADLSSPGPEGRHSECGFVGVQGRRVDRRPAVSKLVRKWMECMPSCVIPGIAGLYFPRVFTSFACLEIRCREIGWGFESPALRFYLAALHRQANSSRHAGSGAASAFHLTIVATAASEVTLGVKVFGQSALGNLPHSGRCAREGRIPHGRRAIGDRPMSEALSWTEFDRD
jgi:hypothetical protein